MNLCEIGLCHILWDVSKGTCDNYHEILRKLCFWTEIYQYISISGVFTKIEKVQEHDTFKLKSNSTSFWFTKKKF